MTITIHVPGWFVDEAKKTLSEGNRYADELRRILIEHYGANPAWINEDTLSEMGTGAVIRTIINGGELQPAADLLADRLDYCSDIGLASFGLTRAQYNKSLPPVCSFCDVPLVDNVCPDCNFEFAPKDWVR